MKLAQFVRNLSLGIKLNAILVTAFVVLLLVPLVVATTATRSLIFDFARQRTLEDLQSAQSHFQEREADLLAQARLLAKSQNLLSSVSTLNAGQVQTTLVSEVASFDLGGADVVDLNGNQIATITRSHLIPNAESGKRLLSLGLAGAEVTGLYPETGQEPNLIMAAAAPLKDARGIVIGALMISREVDPQYLTDIRFGRAGAHLALIFERKILTAEAGTHAIPIKIDGLDRALNGQNWTDEQPFYHENGDPASLSYGPLRIDGDVRAIIAILGEYQELFALERGPVINMAAAIALVALVVIVFSILFMRQSVTVPLTRLQGIAERMAQGDLAQRAQAVSKDEIGRLSGAFNKMVEAIQQRDAKLVEANQTLEKRVQERTAELEQASRQATEASRVKSQFLSTMSHELRTPLNAIIGFTDLLLTGKPGAINDTQRVFLDRAASNGRRLLSLINEILDLSRIEAGRLEFKLAPFSPREMVNSVAAQTSGLFSSKELKFQQLVDLELPEVVVGDLGRVEQIVINLLSNAAKFTVSGEVVLSAEADSDGFWKISVSDTGPGIAPHLQEVIFEPFRQLDGTTTRQHGGSGLGLAICRELCLMMGGKIQVDSETGKGSKFTVRLPIGTVETRDNNIPASVYSIRA